MELLEAEEEETQAASCPTGPEISLQIEFDTSTRSGLQLVVGCKITRLHCHRHRSKGRHTYTVIHTGSMCMSIAYPHLHTCTHTHIQSYTNRQACTHVSHSHTSTCVHTICQGLNVSSKGCCAKGSFLDTRHFREAVEPREGGDYRF